ncbi:MAG: DUF4127 family protein [Firmicutes bacterium]|nr:DUF4127 family protein [Bacillota bacterium]
MPQRDEGSTRGICGQLRRVALLPLDERPCNSVYPALVGRVAGVEVVVPPRSLLGLKKRAGDPRALGEWLKEQAQTADALVVAADTLAFGGLIPSRVSDLTQEEALANLQVLPAIHAARPELPIYAHSVIMRLPAYNSADEEPDYWDDFGARLHLYSTLLDALDQGSQAWDSLRQAGLLAGVEQWAAAAGAGAGGAEAARGGCTFDQARNLRSRLEAEIPAEIRKDWQWRRQRNHALNEVMVRWAAAGVVQFLALTQDDSSPVGLPAREQRALTRLIAETGAYRRVLLYPGADEVGMVLVARLVNRAAGWRPRFWLRFSSTLGPTVVPRYEDRPLLEGIKGQVLAVGGRLAAAPQDADIHLFVNSPGRWQGEAPEQDQPGADHGGWRNLPEFLQSLADTLGGSTLGGHEGAHPGPADDGHPAAVPERPDGPGRCPLVALADVAYANGADRALVEMLPSYIWPLDLAAYAGWNTAGNTLGTVLAHSCLRRAGLNLPAGLERDAADQAHREFLLLRFAEDWAYQADVRQKMAAGPVAQLGISPYELGAHATAIARQAMDSLNAALQRWVARWQEDRTVGPLGSTAELGIQAGQGAWKGGDAAPERQGTPAPARRCGPSVSVTVEDLQFPWNRLFEVQLRVRVDSQHDQNSTTKEE